MSTFKDIDALLEKLEPGQSLVITHDMYLKGSDGRLDNFPSQN